MNIIFGAGKFSNVHLKVLREKGIRKAILAKKSFWTTFKGGWKIGFF